MSAVVAPASAFVAPKGTGGEDQLVGTAQPDRLDGRGGADEIQGLAGADWLIGGSGADAVFGGDGADLIAGGRGNDELDGGKGADRVWGGNGRDFIDIRSGEPDLAFCGAGLDVVRADPTDVIAADCERQSFLSVSPPIADSNRTRVIRFTKEGPGTSDGDVLEITGPTGSDCERLHSIYSLDGPLEGFDVGDIGRFLYGVRLGHDPEHRRFHPRTPRRALKTLCRGVYRVELKVAYCGEGGPCARTLPLERTYFTVV
jgi:hypothetical protein